MPFVNVYIEDRAYGGPEEGGWYYGTREPERCIPVTTWSQAERAARRVERVLECWNEGRPSISSVLSRGRYRVDVERHPARTSPEQRPHYE